MVTCSARFNIRDGTTFLADQLFVHTARLISEKSGRNANPSVTISLRFSLSFHRQSTTYLSKRSYVFLKQYWLIFQNGHDSTIHTRER